MKRVIKFFALFTLLAFIATASPASAGEVTDELKGTIDDILVILKDPSLKGPAKKAPRRAKLRAVIATRFSFKEMSRRSLGKHWKKISTDEKREFVKLFSSLIQNSYFSKMEGYTDEKIIFDKEKTAGKSSIVNTLVITKKGTEIPINYRLKKNKKGNWLVYDIVVEGISLVSNYRTSFGSELRNGKFSDLVAKLKVKAANQAK